MQVVRLSAGGYSCQILHVSVCCFQSFKRLYHLTENVATKYVVIHPTKIGSGAYRISSRVPPKTFNLLHSSLRVF